MRLIDAAALRKAIREAAMENDVTVMDVLTTIDFFPAIEADPVRHGEWVNARKSYYHSYETEVEEQCSLCGRAVYRYDTQPQDFYCPNCGARMDGGGE